MTWQTYLPALILIALAALTWAALRCPRARHWIAALVPAVTAIELFAYGAGYNATHDSAQLFPDNPTIEFLRGQVESERVVGLDGALRPNSAMIWGLRDLRGYEIVVPARLHDLLWRMEGRKGGDPFGLTLDLVTVDSRLLDLLGVRYVVARAGNAGRPPATRDELGRFRQAFVATSPAAEGTLPRVSTAVYENQQALPRAYFVGQASVASDLARLRYQVGRVAFDPRTQVLLEAAQSPPTEGLQDGPAEVEVVVDHPHRVAIRAALDGDGYLVLSDTYDDGWTALIDGQPTPIYRANFALRAVRVGPGTHQIEFVYRPRGFLAGAALTAVSLAIAVVAGCLGRRTNCALEALVQRTGRMPRPGRRFVTGSVAGLSAGVALLAWTSSRPPVLVDGSLMVDARTQAVYRYEAGTKRWVVNENAVNCLQAPGQPVLRYPGLDSLPDGDSVTEIEACGSAPAAGTFVQAVGGPDIYLSTGASLRLVPNPPTLECLTRGRPLQMQVVPPSFLQAVPQGPPLAVGEGC
ncbi:MAG TPA: YfhO family protein [Dehalococcoidia bacterium]|nr:YfhO family protein [Dehalococcoidia bacterium]